MFVARRYYQSVRDWVILIQSHARGCLARKRFVAIFCAHLIQTTVEALVSGHPWDAKKVSVTGASRLENGSRKRPLEMWGIDGRLRELAQPTVTGQTWVTIKQTLKRGTVITVKSL